MSNDDKMDNIKLVTMLTEYGIFCLERQRDVLTAYRKIQREYWHFVFIVLGVIVSAVAIMSSIWCAVVEYIDGWVPVLLTIAAGAFICTLAIAAKTTTDNIHEAKAFIAKASSVPATLDDITYIVDCLNGTEEEEQ